MHEKCEAEQHTAVKTPLPEMRCMNTAALIWSHPGPWPMEREAPFPLVFLDGDQLCPVGLSFAAVLARFVEGGE